MKILAVNTANLGDVVSGLVVTQPLIEQGHMVEVIVKPHIRDLFRGEPGYQVVTPVEAQANSYDLLLDLDSSTESRSLVRRIKATKKLGRFRDRWRWLKMWPNYNFLVPKYGQQHIVRDYYPALTALGFSTHTLPQLHATHLSDVAHDFNSLRLLASRVVMICFGANNHLRRLPVSWLKPLITKCIDDGYALVIPVGPQDDAQFVADLVASAKSSHILLRNYSLSELKFAMTQSDVILAADSGPLHVATALGMKCVGVYGPTLASEYGGMSSRVMSLEKDFPCRPCNQNKPCPFNRRCMLDWTVDEIATALRLQLSS